MIKFICDQCKVNETKSILVIRPGPQDILGNCETFDICETCISELKKIVGQGRRYIKDDVQNRRKL